MTLKSPSFLGTRPNGDILSVGKGLDTKGPAILPASTSLSILPCIIYGYFLALGKLFASVGKQTTPEKADNFRAKQETAEQFTSNQKPCFRYNKGNCTFFPKCKFSHICSKCGGQHPQIRCLVKYMDTS
jgi:hypothetical protein